MTAPSANSPGNLTISPSWWLIGLGMGLSIGIGIALIAAAFQGQEFAPYSVSLVVIGVALITLGAYQGGSWKQPYLIADRTGIFFPEKQDVMSRLRRESISWTHAPWSDVMAVVAGRLTTHEGGSLGGLIIQLTDSYRTAPRFCHEHPHLTPKDPHALPETPGRLVCFVRPFQSNTTAVAALLRLNSATVEQKKQEQLQTLDPDDS